MVGFFLRLVEADSAETDAACAGILQGLLLLGDRRVLPLLDRCWEPLGEEGRRILIHSWSGFVYASTIEFLPGWLECEEDESMYGSIAGTLGGYPLRGDAHPFVLDVERKFSADGEEEGPPVKVAGEWTFGSTGRSTPRV